MLRVLVMWTMLRLTSPLTPHNTPLHNTPQSLWRTTQQINAHTTQHYGPILVGCTARDFLRGCSGIEAFSIEDNRCDCVLEGLNASLVDRGDGTALLRVAIDEGATRPVLGGRALPKRPPRASHFIKGEAVFAGRGDDVCELAIALGGDAFDGTKGTVGACTLIRRGADAVLTGDDVAHVVAPLPSYHTLPTAGAAWAASVVDELVRQGVDRFVVAPGARSAPLALACARDPHVRRNLRVVHDERAAAFYALGHARARSGSCACVVTTSGTAVANLLPAACEADRDSISIVFATADRPAEMRGVGADQVLEQQQDLLRTTLRRGADLPPADDRVAALGDLGEVSSIAAAALRDEDPGPTHVNLAFRENLAPRRGFRRGVGGARNDPGLSVKADWDSSALQGARYATWASNDDPWTRTTSTNKIDASQIMDVLRQSKRGVVVVGRLAPNDVEDVSNFLDELHWPVIHADVRSGIRDVDVVGRRPNAVLEALRELKPDCVLQLGAAPAFAPATRAWLDDAFCQRAKKVVVAPGRSRIDDDFATSLRVEAPPYMIARALYGQRFPPSKLLNPLLRAGVAADEALVVDGFSEPFIARAVTEAASRQKAGLFVSNSMPIRDCDRFGVSIRAEANRGLAGIDGVVATALGYAENHDSEKTFLLIGDQAMLHDAGSLRAVADARQRRLRIVIVDNGGGGIFSFLPLASNPDGIEEDEIVSEDDFETLFGATHSVDFVGLVEAHGLTASRASSASEFERLLDDSSIDVVVATPEVQRKDNVAVHRALEAPAVEAARRSMSHNLAYERFDGNGPPVILLHGLFGSREDLRPLQADLIGREVVMVDLAGHGASATEAGYSYDDQVDGLLALFSQLHDGPVDMVGYSLGARLALGCKLRRPDSIGRVVAVSARLVGLEGDARKERQRSDKALAARVSSLRDEADWAAFFDDVWYAESAKSGIWGDLRRSKVYEEVRRRRLAHLSNNAAASLERAGLGDQPDLRDVASRDDVLLVHGAHDERCARDAASLEATMLPGGHALLDEAPDEIAAAVHGFLSYHHADEEDVVITASVVEDFAVATRKPRENAWAGVASETDAGAVEGAWVVLNGHSIGEAAPCRGVHGESAADARAALRRCAAKLEHVTIPAAVRKLDGSLNRFLHDTCGADAELPSVRFALETAVVGLMTRSPSALYASALGRGARGSVDIAALVDGEDDAPAFLPNRVVKLKAGVLEPGRDAARVRDAVGKHYKVRVDANRRWSREQYEAFLSHLNGAPLDFVEEPPFYSSSVSTALDETLTETDWSPAFDEAEVLVAKPALVGLERTLALARRHGRVVASSCFEAGAGLAHVASIGAALSDDAHGLGTYAWLAEDPFAFEELLDDEGVAWDVASGEAALRAFARRVFERRHHDH